MFGLKKTLFGGEPRAYRQEIGGAWGQFRTTGTAGLASGLVAGTRVATAMGWRQVHAIAEGDMVLTFDRGLQRLRAVTRGRLWDAATQCPKSLWPLKVPAGALGNQEELILLPEQPVMVESDTAEVLFGDPFQLINAADLDGFRGIHRVEPITELEVYQLHFDNDEVVFAGAGALVLCPSLRVINVADLMAVHPDAARYAPLPSDEAALLVECLVDEDTVSLHSHSDGTQPMPFAACA